MGSLERDWFFPFNDLTIHLFVAYSAVMPKFTWIIAGAISGVLLIVLIFASVRGQSLRSDKLERELAEARAQLEKQTAELSASSNRLDEANAAIAKLSEENKSVVQTQQSLEDEMRKALESKEVTISELRGKLTVNILDRILFDSGEADLKPEGQRILEKIADVLAQHTNRQVHIIGHTDDVPIHRKFASNWELSTARATAAVRFLQDQAGVNPRRLGALGYGQFHPIAPNTTAEGRAKNRRIEVVILPQELAVPSHGQSAPLAE
jgi:chemotaxis protein MotB